MISRLTVCRTVEDAVLLEQRNLQLFCQRRHEQDKSC